MRFIFFVIFVIGAVAASPIGNIRTSASASASVNGETVVDQRETRTAGGAVSASASASASSSTSGTYTTGTAPVIQPVQASAQAEAKVDLSQVNFKTMTAAEVEAFRAANPDCQIVVRKVTPSPCVVRTPCATLVKRIAPCAPPPCYVYQPCSRIPVPCQTKTVRKSASARARASVCQEVKPEITVIKTDTPCAPTTTVVKKIDPVKLEAKSTASASASIDESITPVVVC